MWIMAKWRAVTYEWRINGSIGVSQTAMATNRRGNKPTEPYDQAARRRCRAARTNDGEAM